VYKKRLYIVQSWYHKQYFDIWCIKVCAEHEIILQYWYITSFLIVGISAMQEWENVTFGYLSHIVTCVTQSTRCQMMSFLLLMLNMVHTGSSHTTCHTWCSSVMTSYLRSAKRFVTFWCWSHYVTCVTYGQSVTVLMTKKACGWKAPEKQYILVLNSKNSPLWHDVWHMMSLCDDIISGFSWKFVIFWCQSHSVTFVTNCSGVTVCDSY
jgi:hypothetical protein